MYNEDPIPAVRLDEETILDQILDSLQSYCELTSDTVVVTLAITSPSIVLHSRIRNWSLITPTDSLSARQLMSVIIDAGVRVLHVCCK